MLERSFAHITDGQRGPHHLALSHYTANTLMASVVWHNKSHSWSNVYEGSASLDQHYLQKYRNTWNDIGQFTT
jgi:hypothetical protein